MSDYSTGSISMSECSGVLHILIASCKTVVMAKVSCDHPVFYWLISKWKD